MPLPITAILGLCNAPLAGLSKDGAETVCVHNIPGAFSVAVHSASVVHVGKEVARNIHGYFEAAGQATTDTAHGCDRRAVNNYAETSRRQVYTP